jgi:hypothetical protein
MTVGGICRWAVVVVVVATSLAVHAADAQEPGSRTTLIGQAEPGGSVSFTLSPDNASIERVELGGIPLANCYDAYVSKLVYYDPPVPITDGRFEFVVRDGGSAHGMWTVDVSGTFLTPNHVIGTFHYSSIPCSELPEWGFELLGTIDTPPDPTDLLFHGAIGAGDVTVTTTADGSRLTSVMFTNVDIAPCRPYDPVIDVPAIFIPALKAGDDGAFHAGFSLGEAGPFSNSFITARLIHPDTIEGTLSVSVAACRREFPWQTTLGSPAPPVLPVAGTRASTSTPLPALVAVTILGGLLLTLGLRLRLR